LDALAEVAPGGHFFGANHTMQRYQTEFYEPFIHDCSNFGSWSEAGAKDADHRATDVWKKILQEGAQYDAPGDRVENLEHYIDKRSGEGGAPPIS